MTKIPKPESLGRALRDARVRAGLSQEQVAEQIGVLRPTVTMMENGKRQIHLQECMQLADVYGVSLRTLIEEATHSPHFREVRQAMNLLVDLGVHISVENIRMVLLRYSNHAYADREIEQLMNEED